MITYRTWAYGLERLASFVPFQRWTDEDSQFAYRTCAPFIAQSDDESWLWACGQVLQSGFERDEDRRPWLPHRALLRLFCPLADATPDPNKPRRFIAPPRLPAPPSPAQIAQQPTTALPA